MPEIWLLIAARCWDNLGPSSGMQAGRPECCASECGRPAIWLCGRVVAAPRDIGYDMHLAAGSLSEVGIIQLGQLRTHRDAIRHQMPVSPHSTPIANAHLYEHTGNINSS